MPLDLYPIVVYGWELDDEALRSWLMECRVGTCEGEYPEDEEEEEEEEDEDDEEDEVDSPKKKNKTTEDKKQKNGKKAKIDTDVQCLCGEQCWEELADHYPSEFPEKIKIVKGLVDDDYSDPRFYVSIYRGEESFDFDKVAGIDKELKECARKFTERINGKKAGAPIGYCLMDRTE